MKLLNRETELRFPSTPFHLCVLDVRAAVISANVGAPLGAWVEPGMGDALGFAFQLPNGVSVLVEELQHLVEHFGALGPTLQVDARSLAEHGPDALIELALVALQVAPEAVSWRQDEAGRAVAARF